MFFLILVPRTKEAFTLKADAIASSVELNLISSDDSDSTASPSPESHASPLMEDVAVQLNARADMINIATIQIIPKGKLTKATDAKATGTKAMGTKAMGTKPSDNTPKNQGSSNQPKPSKPRLT